MDSCLWGSILGVMEEWGRSKWWVHFPDASIKQFAALDKERTSLWSVPGHTATLCSFIARQWAGFPVSSARTHTQRKSEECTYFSFISRHQISSSMESPWITEKIAKVCTFSSLINDYQWPHLWMKMFLLAPTFLYCNSRKRCTGSVPAQFDHLREYLPLRMAKLYHVCVWLQGFAVNCLC